VKIVDIAPKVLPMIEQMQRKSELFGRPVVVHAAIQTLYGFALGAMGNFEEGERLIDERLSFLLEMGHLWSLGAAQMAFSRLSRFKGDAENILKHCKQSIRYFEELQAPLWLGQVWSCLGFGYYLLGDLEAALKNIEKGLKIQSDIGVQVWLSDHHFYLTMIHVDLADFKKAKHHVKEALSLSHKANEKDNEGLSRIFLGRIMLKTDHLKAHKAEESILKGIKILEEIKSKPHYSMGYLYLGELYADVGRTEEALESLKKAESMFQEMGMDYWLAKTQEALGNL
jgi:tetratricopeptide (TPR) repeat protein